MPLESEQPNANTLRELLVEIRDGYALYAPVLIQVQVEPFGPGEITVERTVTQSTPLDWAEQYTREYANESYLIVGANTLKPSLDEPVSIGRSRSCNLRIENESVSKRHASIHFDRLSGGYFIVDEHSRNGTCINGEVVVSGVKTALWSGAYVSFGDAVFVFIDPPTLRKLSRLATVS
jgi:pSer/pThr/pTyr-binding forkhead associated (FHA) protein